MMFGENPLRKIIVGVIVAVPIAIAVNQPKHLQGHAAWVEGQSRGSDWVSELDSGEDSSNYYLDKVAARKAAEDGDADDKDQFIQGFIEGAHQADCRRALVEWQTVREWGQKNGIRTFVDP